MKRLFLIAASFLVLVSATTYGWWRYQERQWTTFTSDNPKIHFVYPRVLQSAPSSETEEEQKNLRLLFRASAEQSPTPFNVNLRMETGLRIVANLTKREVVDIVLGNADKAHPQRFSNYQKLSEKKFEHSKKPAGELLFTYTGPTDEIIKQRLLIVAYDDDTVLYLAAQAKANDFDALNRRYFTRLFSSLSFSFASVP